MCFLESPVPSITGESPLSIIPNQKDAVSTMLYQQYPRPWKGLRIAVTRRQLRWHADSVNARRRNVRSLDDSAIVSHAISLDELHM